MYNDQEVAVVHIQRASDITRARSASGQPANAAAYAAATGGRASWPPF